MKLASFIVLAFIAMPQNGNTQKTVTIHNGWMKAQDYIELTPEPQRAYVMGLLDGFYSAPLFGAPDNDRMLTNVARCVEGMKSSQVAAIILKYTTDHPERGNRDIKDTAYQSILGVCPVR